MAVEYLEKRAARGDRENFVMEDPMPVTSATRFRIGGTCFTGGPARGNWRIEFDFVEEPPAELGPHDEE